MAQVLSPLHERRTNEVVVTTMSAARPWGRISDHPLDFASVDGAMGHGADLALGIALARPERKVICLNGDGSMLMTLGTLVTVVGARASNLILLVCDNGQLEATDDQPVAGAGSVDYAAFAQAARFRRVFRFDDARAYAEALPTMLSSEGPIFVHAVLRAGNERPISRGPTEDAAYLRVSLAESARRVQAALAARPST
jgi:thiamine pyrophosphate-dependent acetolactate synthase large subunit-like protein